MPDAISTFTKACPFCDGTFSDMCDPETGEANGLLHTVPPCAKFDELDPLDFVIAVNRLAGTAPEDA